MAANNYFNYGGTQYAAANASYQPSQQPYAMPSATGASTAAASYSSQRSAYDAGAYQTTAKPVTYATQGVGVTYDSSKTFYQQAASAASAVAATTTQGAASVASSPDFQNWQQANFNARHNNAAALAAVQGGANKAAYGTNYTGVPTTRQLTVPPISAKGQANSNSTPYSAQYASPQSSATNYHYSNTATTNKVAAGTIGQPPKKPVSPYQQKPGVSMAGNSNMSSQGNVAANYGGGNAVNSGITATAYAHVSAIPYTNATNAMYSNATPSNRPKGNQAGVATSNSSAAYSNPYDAALFNAAATMFMNQNPRGGSKAGGNYKPRPGLGSNPKLRNFRPPKPQQLHYCDACKISCAGPSAYHDHLQGQKHKKKVAKAKPEPVKGKPPAGGNLPVFICELCDIECTAADAYAAHLRGAKHTKVVKLHTRLGKPIPPPDPKASAAIAALNAQEEKAKASNGAISSAVTISAAPTVKAPTTPRITFVAAGNSAAASTTTAISATASKPEDRLDDSTEDDKKDNDLLIDDRPAVGSEYIEEEKDATGKLISFNCKLCECKFSDPNAKEMHMKGRKHRLQFKKKVDPKLKVEMKPNNFKHKRNEKWKKQAEKPKEIRKKDFRYDEEMKDYVDWCRKPGPSVNVPGVMPQGMRLPLMRSTPRPLMMGPGLSRLSAAAPAQPPMFMLGPSPLQQRKPDSFEDRYVLSRHKAIYPSDVELQNIQMVVGHVEKALKLVSDCMLNEIEEKLIKEEEVKTEAADEPTENENENDDSAADDSRMSKEDSRGSLRELTGVLRVGIIAKCLILSGDDSLDLVMLCSKKPTLTLLTKVVSLLPEQLKEVCKDAEYTVTAKPADAAIVITTRPQDEEAKPLIVTVTLTSTVIREEIMAVSEKILKEENAENDDETASGDGSKVPKEISPDPPDVLSKTKCLEALAALRHAKWFQARAATIPSCLIIIRILRDLCRRVPTWMPFNSWAMELLCEKVLSTTSMGLSPGDGLRRVFECISSGILLPHGPGLLDPCEKDPVDAAAYLTPQQREDITESAQVALRLIAFRQIHKVLGMEPLPPLPKFRSKQPNRKRRRENSAGGRNEEVDGKKDKKEDDDHDEKENENENEDEFGEERMETTEPSASK